MRIKKVGVLFFLGAGILATAQTKKENKTDTAKVTSINEVVLVGSRNVNRTVTDSPVPVDVINVKVQSEATGLVNVNQLLQFTAPSFNANNQSGSDEADAVEPATLRGLGPDQTLVLLNGLRYHQSSLINLFGTRGRGNTGTDMNTIPTAAIKNIEILRDGASAQYGTDAIAGVVDVILNDRNHGFVGDLYYGADIFKSPGNNNDIVSDHKIDGQVLNFSGNLGTKIGKKGGFGNFTLDYQHKQHYIRNANPDMYSASRQKFGGAASDNFYYFGNIEIPISDGLILYSQNGYSFRNTRAFAWTRFPDDDGNIPSVYPNGFNPIENTGINDITFNNGFKFKVAGWNVNAYNAFGYNKFSIDVNNTINATLGATSPTKFYAGNHSLLQNVTGFNSVKNYKDVMSGLNIAFGSEVRWEGYNLNKGTLASYAMYDVNGDVVTDQTDPNLLVTNPISGDIRPGGSQGFPGYANSVHKSRTNAAAYVDTELDFTKDFMIDVAARYEHYSDVGSVIAGKLATRYALSPSFAIRGSISNGFRAPSLAQKYYGLTFTNFVGGKLVTVLLSPNDSQLANAVGIPKLKQETSINGSGGFVITTPKFSATVDGYYVKVKNRIVLTGYFDRSILVAATGGVGVPIGLDQAQFFSNALDTRTLGMDIIMTYHDKIGSGNFMATLAANINDMKIENIHTSAKLAGLEDVYLSARERAFILASAPKSKINLTLNYTVGMVTTNLQLMRFNKVRLIGYNSDTDYQDYAARYTADLSVGLKFTKNINWFVGMNNIFNQYPTLQRQAVSDGDTESGGIFDPVQMGFEGRQIFTRLVFNF